MIPLALALLATAAAHPAPLVLHPGDRHALVFTTDVRSVKSSAPGKVAAKSPDERTVQVEAKALGQATLTVALLGAPARVLQVRVEPTPALQPTLGSQLALEDEDEDGEAAHAHPGPPDPAHFGGKRILRARCDPPPEHATPDAVDARIGQARSTLELDPGRAAAARAEQALKAVLQTSPRAARAYLYLGEAELRRGNDRAAARAYETYLRSCPTTIHAQRVRGLLGTYRAQLARARAAEKAR